MKTFTHHKITALTLAVISAALVGCASEPSVVTTRVQPATSTGQNHGTGMLTVYTATDTRTIGDGPAYHPHSSYVIYNEEGKQVMFVANHVGDMDEAPQIVTLPAGNYSIKASSESAGRVTIPITVKAYRTTAIHLTGKADQTAHNGTIKLPDGKIVGWAAAR